MTTNTTTHQDSIARTSTASLFVQHLAADNARAWKLLDSRTAYIATALDPDEAEDLKAEWDARYQRELPFSAPERR